MELTEVAVRRRSLKQVLLRISQYSQENTCVELSFLIKLQALGLENVFETFLQKRLQVVNIAKFLRTAFSAKHLRWLLLG